MGAVLLADAFRKILTAAESVAAYAIVVDAKDEQAVRFYQGYGFVRLAARPNRLFILAATAEAALAAAAK